MKHCIVILLVVLGLSAIAQQQSTDSVTINRVKKIKEYVYQNNYKGAEEELKKIFAKRPANMPDEVAYLNGAVLFHQKKYTQAKTSLLKYLSLTNEQGTFTADTKALLLEIECAETGYYTRTDTCLVCHGVGRLEDKCPNCGGKGLEFCHACGGGGVATSVNGFGNSYTTCKKCQGKGYHTCTLCNGSKKQTRLCNSCNGTGMSKFKLKCKK